jgi:hypothetical protein
MRDSRRKGKCDSHKPIYTPTQQPQFGGGGTFGWIHTERAFVGALLDAFVGAVSI